MSPKNQIHKPIWPKHLTGYLPACKRDGTLRKPNAKIPTPWPHPNGFWRVRLNGKEYYLTRWNETADGSPRDALAEWKLLVDAIDAGTVHTPNDRRRIYTIAEVCRLFLDDCHRQTERLDKTGKPYLSHHTYRCYRETCLWLLGNRSKPPVIDPTTPWSAATLDGGAAIAAALRDYAPKTQKDRIVHLKRISNWTQGMHRGRKCSPGLPVEPLDLSRCLPPPRLVERRHRRSQSPKVITPIALLHALTLAKPDFRAMILLAINSAADNSGIAAARIEYFHLDATPPIWEQSRDKTEAHRSVTLWPETVAALRAAEPIDGRGLHRNRGLWWRTANHLPLVHTTGKGTTDGIADRWNAIRRKLPKEHAPPPGIGFGVLKRTALTIAAKGKDNIARAILAGHVVDGVAELYVQEWDALKIHALTQDIRRWLYASPTPLPRYDRRSGKLLRPPASASISWPAPPQTVSDDFCGVSLPFLSQNP